MASYTTEWRNGRYVRIDKPVMRVVSLDAVTRSNVRGSSWKVRSVKVGRDQVTRATAFQDGWHR